MGNVTKIVVLAFGPLTEILEKESMIEALDTAGLFAELITKHPSLERRKILMTVNGHVINENTMLKENDTVALMPPYSGG